LHCGFVKKSNRKHRGLYVCSECGLVLNADVNSSKNILQKGIPIVNFFFIYIVYFFFFQDLYADITSGGHLLHFDRCLKTETFDF